MLDRPNARRWTHASQGAAVVLLVAGALASTRDYHVNLKPPTPAQADQPGPDAEYQPPPTPAVDTAMISEGLTRPRPPIVENPDPDVIPDADPDPDAIAEAPTDELRYLGPVRGGGKRLALVAMGDRQRLVAEGRDFEGLEIVSAEADRLLVRDDAGEREIAKSRRTGSRFTEVTIKGGGDDSSIGARELSKRGGIREDMRRRIEDLQRAAIRDNPDILEALDDEARAAHDKAQMDQAAAEARRAINAKRKPQPAQPSPGEQGP